MDTNAYGIKYVYMHMAYGGGMLIIYNSVHTDKVVSASVVIIYNVVSTM